MSMPSATPSASPPTVPKPLASSSSTASEFDPHAAFIAEDGLEYENLARYICAEPVDCFRNNHIRQARERGRSEEAIRTWIKGYDGDDPTPSYQLTVESRCERQVRANFAVHPWGGPVTAEGL